jgi:two-component system, sensor histidine kinase
LLQVGLALGLLGVLVAIGLALAIGYSVIRPIQRLAVAMVELGRGGRPAPLLASGGGEFRTLNEGFNQMVVRLQAAARDLQQRIDEATRELVVQKDAAEQATNAKSRFIAAASHDLRQPLHAIGLFTATLQRRARETGLEAVVEDLAQSVAVMQRLFDSLLDISRLDAEGVRPELTPFPLDRLFTQLATEHIDAAERKRLRLYIRSTTAIVLTDELLLHRLMNNLVANAIRYTNEGTVLVCARPRGDEIQIEVRDSGIGIPVEKQGDIFQEFYQIGNAARDRSLGLGLGLAIVARIARLLNTEVIVRSAPGRGSVFRLRVSRGRSDVQSEATVTETNDGVGRLDSMPISILVVDDDPLVLAGNRALLEALGCEVVTVSDDEQAKEALKAFGQKPVLVLCDLWLSDRRSGIDVLRILSELTTPPISGILISGDTRPETIQAARAAGYPMLHKPVSPARLRAVISHFASTLPKNITTDVRDEDSAR